MRKWIWYMLALLCMIVAFTLTPTFTWEYLVSVFLYMLAGCLVWSHTDYKPPRRRRPSNLTLDLLREVDKEYR